VLRRRPHSADDRPEPAVPEQRREIGEPGAVGLDDEEDAA
jgi:hypothetical protein